VSTAARIELSPLAQAAQREGIGPLWQCIVFLLLLAALFTRRPDMFLHAQFYAEDGKYWYADAYNLGWVTALTVPVGGYLNVLSHLVAAFTLLFPLRDAPLLMNIAGLIIQVLPVTALLSARCKTWGPLPLRALMAFIYIIVPNAWEIHVVLTNAHWHLAVLELLLAFAAPPRSWVGRIGDVLLFTIGSVSDPFCVFLLPLLLIYWWSRRERWTLLISSLTAIGAAIQMFTILHAFRPAEGPLGATPALLLRFLAGNIVIDGTAGLHSVVDRIPGLVLLFVLAFAGSVVAYAFAKGALPLRLYILFTIVFFATALKNPLLHGPLPRWQLLLDDFGCRYWYYPKLALLWSASTCLFVSPKLARVAGCCILLPLLFGFPREWRYLVPPQHNFRMYADRFEQLKPGEHLVIPLNPSDWSMELTKHASPR